LSQKGACTVSISGEAERAAPGPRGAGRIGASFARGARRSVPMSSIDTRGGPISQTLYLQLTDLRQGAKTAWPPNLTAITFQQESVTQPQFDTLCADEIAPFQGAKDAFATWRAALVTREASLAGAKQFIAAVYALLPGFLGRNSPNHSKWSAAPKKPRRPLTSEQK